MNKKEAQGFVDSFNKACSEYIGKEAIISFSVHKFTTVIESVCVAYAYELKGLLDKRQREDGSFYTPITMKLNCTDGNLFFVVEDISYFIRLSGIDIIFGDDDRYKLRITRGE